MKTKLTLTVEKDVIEQAKDYAKATGISLSELIQNYLKRISSKSNLVAGNIEIAEGQSEYRKMAGIAKSDLDPVKDRDKLREIRLEKYNR
jgi:antitoxin component of RelBE/YafQ-DinJ toxin-antitoxin module